MQAKNKLKYQYLQRTTRTLVDLRLLSDEEQLHKKKHIFFCKCALPSLPSAYYVHFTSERVRVRVRVCACVGVRGTLMVSWPDRKRLAQIVGRLPFARIFTRMNRNLHLKTGNSPAHAVATLWNTFLSAPLYARWNGLGSSVFATLREREEAR